MSRRLTTGTAGFRIRRAPRLFEDLSLAVVAYLVSSLGFLPHAYNIPSQPSDFRRNAYSGIYRHRIIGRELVLFVYDHCPSSLLGSRFANLNVPGPGQLYAAMVIVNGAAFLIFAGCLHALLKRYLEREPQRTLVFAAGVLVVAFGSYVVTPYDQTSYALFALFALLALSNRRALEVLSVPVGVLGVLNRESMLLGLAMLGGIAVASVVAREPERARRLAILLGANALAMVATYVGLRLADSGRGGDVWAQSIFERNLQSMNSWVGVVIVALGYPVWWRLWRVLGLAPSSTARVGLRAFYVFSVPYLLVILFTGLWSETRLVVPLLIGEIVVRLALLTGEPPETPGVNDTERNSRSATSLE